MSSYLPYMFLHRVSKIAWLFYLQRTKCLYMYLQLSLIFLWNIRRSIWGRKYQKWIYFQGLIHFISVWHCYLLGLITYLELFSKERLKECIEISFTLLELVKAGFTYLAAPFFTYSQAFFFAAEFLLCSNEKIILCSKIIHQVMLLLLKRNYENFIRIHTILIPSSQYVSVHSTQAAPS